MQKDRSEAEEDHKKFQARIQGKERVLIKIRMAAMCTLIIRKGV